MKTNELSGAALDWAVKKAIKKDGGYFLPSKDYKNISHSTDWAQGGPIIEREVMRVSPNIGRGWSAQVWRKSVPITEFGPTPLVAAMRCYVASKLGDEVEVPDALT